MGLLSKRNKEINKVLLLPLESIVKSPHQARKHFDPDALQDLARSIVANGLLQPITVRKQESGSYELIAGERRTMAFRALGREFIPAIIESYTNDESAVLSLIENLQRKNLNYFEEAQGIAKLMDLLGLTQQQISVRLGKAQSTVANKLRLLKYSVEVRQQMLDANFTERHARALLKINDVEMLAKTIEVIAQKKLNVEQTEAYVESILVQKTPPNGSKMFVIKDVRIFINSINKAVAVMNHAGIAVGTEKLENDDFVEYIIKIPRAAVYKSNPQLTATPIKSVAY